MNTFFTAFAAFAGFAILIILHEAGHFAAAKAVGMRVEKFMLFFGKPLVGFRRGETYYGIGWIPAGGFVKITGMNPHEELDPEVEHLRPHQRGAEPEPRVDADREPQRAEPQVVRRSSRIGQHDRNLVRGSCPRGRQFPIVCAPRVSHNCRPNS